MGNLINGVAFIIDSVLTIYFWIVIASAVLSWVNPDPFNPIVRFLRNATEPVYIYIRRYMPFLNIGGFDLSPIVLILLIQFLRIVIVGNLYDLSGSMQPQQSMFMR